jgi:hypothetical protein
MSKKCEVLRVVQEEVLTSPARWTKGVFARDKEGFGVHAISIYATCWCFYGAIRKACHLLELTSLESAQAEDALAAAGSDKLHQQSVVTWQDSSQRTFEDMQQFLTKLREDCKETV